MRSCLSRRLGLGRPLTVVLASSSSPSSSPSSDTPSSPYPSSRSPRRSYTSAEALLYNMPSGAVQLVTTLTIAFWADKGRVRMLPFIAGVIPSIVGFALLLAYSNAGSTKDHKTVLLVGVFLSQTFVSALSLLFSWSASNIAGSSKRSIVNGALLVSFAGGNICGSQAFQQSTAPQYLPGASSSSLTLSPRAP